MKRLISWLLVMAMAIACLPMSAFAAETEIETEDKENDFEVDFGELTIGTAENPYVIVEGNPRLGVFTTITVPAGEEVYATADCTASAYTLYMNTYDGAYNVVYNQMTGMYWTSEGDADNGFSINQELQQGGVYTLKIQNLGESDISIMSYLTAIQAPGATWDTAVELQLGDNVSTHAEGSAEFYYTYTAEQTGILVLNFSSDVDGWFYCVNNLTTYAYGDGQWSDSDPVVNPAEIEVTEGDLLQIQVNTYDAANPWTAPAGTVTVNASYKAEYVPYVVETRGYGLSLEAELKISSKFVLPAELAADENAMLKIQFIDEVTEIKLVDYLADPAHKDSKGRMIIEQSVKSFWMTHLVNVTITDGNGYAVNYVDYFGDSHEGSYQFGAENYVRTMDLAGETTINAVRALLTYGAYAQQYFATTGKANITEQLATEILTKYGYEPVDISGITVADFTQATAGAGDNFDGISIRGNTPTLDAAIFMKVQFNASGMTEADMGNYTYKLSYTVGNTKIEEELVPEWDSRGRLVFYVYDIAAMLFDCMYDITITKTATGESYTGSTSIVAYMNTAYESFSGNVPFQNLLKAMYAYNQAANTHFGK